MTSQTNITALYAELNKAIHISDYRQALKSANKSKLNFFTRHFFWMGSIQDLLNC